jgi:GNAT superfamily N-acetyltransferase
MSLEVRPARAEDADAIRALGLGDPAFAVSERIPFYEREELLEWAADPAANLLFVAESEGEVAGFFFCKVISYHWAMLDNFYVKANKRGSGVATALHSALVAELRQRGIVYLSTLVSCDDPKLVETLRHLGFSTSKAYHWYELFL